ncbi:MAG: M13 family metallopeptidase [Kofleriaceae bacterium]
MRFWIPFVGMSLATAVMAQPAPEPIPALVPGLDARFIDRAADPCTDFFKYACGKFSTVYPIPNDQSSWGAGAVLGEHTEAVLHAMLEKAAGPARARSEAEAKIGDYYATCMNTAAIDKKGLSPFKVDLDKITALKTKADIVSVVGRNQVLNNAAFVALYEQQDYADASKQIAVIDQAGLGLPERDYYVRTGDAADKTRKQYVEHVTNMLKLSGESAAQAATDAKAVFAFETELAKLSMDITSRRDPHNTYHVMSVADAAKLMPALSLDKLLSVAQVPKIDTINVGNPDFMKGMNGLIEKTGLDVIKAYLRWQLIASIDSTALPSALDKERFAFFGKTLRGAPEQRVRWKRCVAATDAALPELLGQVYVAQEFPAANKAATLQMIHDIETAMDADIDTLDWMSATTKTRAKAKLKLVAEKIGYPDKWRDYSKVTVARDDAYGNWQRSILVENARQFAKIGQPIDRGEWLMSPPTIDAYYNPSMNDINFPAGILQSPFYDPSASDALNYGHAGAVIGHELTHGFDDQGRQFDGKGNLADWWSGDDGKKFDKKAQCTVDEYSSFVAVDDVHVNGKLTLGENTADNGGLRLAYQAFLIDAKRKHIDVTKKQANGFTPAQEFFLGHGQNWCGETRPEQVRLQVQTDPHSPREFRVNGVVRNMPDFAKAFSCKANAPMAPAPAQVCRTW